MDNDKLKFVVKLPVPNLPVTSIELKQECTEQIPNGLNNSR